MNFFALGDPSFTRFRVAFTDPATELFVGFGFVFDEKDKVGFLLDR